MAGDDWLVQDSEDEAEMLLQPIAQPPAGPASDTTTTSPISYFTTTLPANQSEADETSPIIQAPTARPSYQVPTSIDTISTPTPQPDKPKRPKPRPAYKKAKEAAAAAAANTTSPIVVTDPVDFLREEWLNATDATTPKGPQVQNGTGSSSRVASYAFDGVVIPRNTVANHPRMDASRTTVVDLSSDEDTASRSRPPPKTQRKPVFRVPDPPPMPSSSILPPSEPPSTVPSSRPPSPVFGGNRANSTPPSSPVVARPKKRKSVVVDDDEDYGASNTSADAVQGKKKKKPADGQSKEKKTRAKKRPEAESATVKPPRSKAKAKDVEQQACKSREFIDDSDGDDDLLLRPSPSADRSLDNSVRASNVSTAPVSSRWEVPDPDRSVRASISASVQPTAPISIGPSADLSVPSSSNARSKAPIGTKPTSERNGKSPLADGGSVMEKSVPAKKKKKKAAKDVPNARGSSGLKSTHMSDTHNEPASSSSLMQRPESPLPSPKKPKKRSFIESSDEGEPESPSKKAHSPAKKATETGEHDKENNRQRAQPTASVPATPLPPSSSTKPLNSTPRIPPRRDSMSALIRRASSKVHSPLGTPSPKYIHSPLAKSSRGALARIAPLHPNRRSPPPAPPKPPAPKKSKKMLDLEEKWEEELSESVEGWACFTEEERAALKRAKRDAELGYED